LTLELLERRTLLSSSIPLYPDIWTPIGPAPLLQGTTTYREATSGRIAALAAHPTDPNTLYVAAAGGGVWKTVDAGVSWVPLTDTQATLSMGALALAPSNPDVIYAGTGEATFGPSKVRLRRDNIYTGHGILKSSDGGLNWTVLGNTEFDRLSISKIVVDPNDSDTVYVAVGATATNGRPRNPGVWKSGDGGLTWSQRLVDFVPLSDTDAVSDLVMDPNDPQTLFAAVGTPSGSTANGIYQTTDGGDSWSRVGTFPTGAEDVRLGRMKVAIAPGNSQVLFVSVAASGLGGTVAGEVVDIYKTVDGGQSWSPLNMGSVRLCTSGGSMVTYLDNEGDYHSTLAVDPANVDRMYAGGLCLLRSSDGGTSWTNIANGQTTGPHHDHHAIGFDAAGHFLDGNDGGIWRLDNISPVRWANLNTDLQITQFNSIALTPGNADVAYGGAQDNGFVRFQDDYAWPRLERGDGGAAAVSASQPNTVYQIVRGTTTLNANFLRRSDDGGQTWRPVLNGINVRDPKLFYPPLVMSPSNSSRLLLGTDRVYETTNGGGQWVARSVPRMGGWTVNTPIDSVAIAPSLAARLYAATAGHIFTTADRTTQQWTEVSLPIQDHVAMVVVRPTASMTAYAVRDRFGGGHVWRTTNAGGHWTDISGNLPDLPVYALAVDNRFPTPRLFIGTDNGVYVSDDTGASWAPFKAWLPNVLVNSLQLDPTLNILAAGTHGRGVWEIEVDGPTTPRALRDPEEDERSPEADRSWAEVVQAAGEFSRSPGYGAALAAGNYPGLARSSPDADLAAPGYLPELAGAKADPDGLWQHSPHRSAQAAHDAGRSRLIDTVLHDSRDLMDASFTVF
jgi:photosystem II stability/assembly factor-like uncharacterized protein